MAGERQRHTTAPGDTRPTVVLTVVVALALAALGAVALAGVPDAVVAITAAAGFVIILGTSLALTRDPA